MTRVPTLPSLTDTDTTPPKSEIANIQQNIGYAENDKVTVQGLVASPDVGYGFFLQDSYGPYTGIWVYTGGDQAKVQIGDAVEISGTYYEYSGLSEIDISKDYAGTLTVASSGNPLPPPVTVSTSDLANKKTAEMYEGVLITVENVEVTNPDLGYGEFEIDSSVAVDDLFYLHKPAKGDTLTSITGQLTYTYGAYKIVPHNADSIVP